MHFDRRFVPPDAIGHRALAVNLSDLAAMGAGRAPRCCRWCCRRRSRSRRSTGSSTAARLAARHGVALIGGNITRTPGPLVDRRHRDRHRQPRADPDAGGARPGDDVYVTGTLGRGGRPVRLQAATRTTRRRRRPLSAARASSPGGHPARPQRAASSCMDLSDGLADGVRRSARGVRCRNYARRGSLPISQRCREWLERQGRDPVDGAARRRRLRAVLHGAGRNSRPAARRAAASGDLPITRIGVVTQDRACS